MTKKLKKSKVKHYFALEPELSFEFTQYLDRNCIDKQKLIEKFIIEYLTDIKNNKIK